jgi:protocatechuate 3,4-dioxygenase alpha subunit
MTESRLDNQDPSLFGQTPSQTVGPFFHYGLPWRGGADLVGASELGARPELFPEAHNLLNLSAPRGRPEGEAIEIVGRVLDGEGAAVPDAMIEIWQANAAGRYASPDDPRSDVPLDPPFIGFGRASTGEDGSYLFRTVRPGTTPGPGNRLQAPHIAFSVFGRGLVKRLATRLYFEGHFLNAEDPILAHVPEQRRPTLLACNEADGRWRFDIRLQGEGETVFFAL